MFTLALCEHLAMRHRVKPNALGWPHQIAQLAERRSLDWMEVYLLVSSEVLGSAAESEVQNAEPDAAEDGWS